jgi:hypothetical protein
MAEKPLIWLGSSLGDPQTFGTRETAIWFPSSADSGRARPDDWKPMRTLGPGAGRSRIHNAEHPQVFLPDDATGGDRTCSTRLRRRRTRRARRTYRLARNGSSGGQEQVEVTRSQRTALLRSLRPRELSSETLASRRISPSNGDGTWKFDSTADRLAAGLAHHAFGKDAAGEYSYATWTAPEAMGGSGQGDWLYKGYAHPIQR